MTMQIRSNVFLRDDLVLILRAIAWTQASAGAAYDANPQYTAGFNAAVVAFGLAIGMPAPEISRLIGGTS